MPKSQNVIAKAVTTLKSGGVIAYPTEAVYGLGCDPHNEKAVLHLLSLKKRAVNKGLILLASSWQQVAIYTAPITQDLLQKALNTWPGPHTWIFPAQLDKVPTWIRGAHHSIAIRVTAHPLAQAICAAFAGCIVSTSANIEGQPPARNSGEVLQQFPQGIDYILEGPIGNLEKPTPIRDVLSNELLRS
jgi:L-threonylcarbamoyladenylate synthase